MNLVKISVYAEGYYSGQTYAEEYFIKEESYNRLKEEIDNIDIYIGDLDGKHSEVPADLQIEVFSEEMLLKSNIEEMIQNSDDLACELIPIYNKIGLDFIQELSGIDKYLSELNTYITFKATIKKSQRKLVEDFIRGLN